MSSERGRSGVSELYASILLVGVTLSFGGVIAVSAMNQFGLTTNSSAQGALLSQATAGKQISLVYGTISTPGGGGCTTMYGGILEGTGYSLVVYNYGNIGFTPIQIFDNGTLLSGGPYSTSAPGSAVTYALTLSCAHPSGQTFFLVDSSGDEAQIGT